MKRFSTILILANLICCSLLVAQRTELCPASESKKSVRYFEDAKNARKAKKDYEQIKSLCQKSITEDSTWAAPWLLLGDAARFRKDFPAMKKAYTKALAICPDIDANAHFYLGTYLYDTKKYQEAVPYLKSYLDFSTENESKNREAESLLFRAKLISNPVPFNPVIVPGITTSDPEYLPAISPDNEFCFFTRRYEEILKSSLTPKSVEKFMVAQRQSDGSFNRGEPMPFPFNLQTSNNEGGSSISKDNKFLYFTKNENGNFDLYFSENTKGVWGPVTNLGNNVNDTAQWDAQPSVASDGKTIYFTSYRDSLLGTCDIFRITKQNGGFSKPVRMPFNTNGNDKSPFIHPDGKTFYFSSDSLPGMGGFDIYMIKRQPDNSWGEPINLGYPINTENDEVGFFVSTDGKRGYFASDKLSGRGGYDIYSFEIPTDKRPDKVLLVKGQLKSDNEDEPLAARIELRNLTTSELAEVDYDSLTGKYASVVLFDADYIMTVKQEGYAYNSQYFSQEDSSLNGVTTANLDFRKMEVGAAYTLNNILFKSKSAELTPASEIIIKDFAKFLNDNPKVQVAIHGHTDSSGDPANNLRLSNDRAHAVYDFLVKSGIPAARLSWKGFGQTKPVADNESEVGKAKNRRTEFVIINK